MALPCHFQHFSDVLGRCELRLSCTDTQGSCRVFMIFVLARCRYSYANFLLPARIEADDARFLSHGGDPAATEFRWQLPEDPEPWDRMSKDILALEQALAYEDIFWKLQGLSVVALLARLLKDMVGFLNRTQGPPSIAAAFRVQGERSGTEKLGLRLWGWSLASMA